MNKPALADMDLSVSLCCLGVMLAGVFSLAQPVFGKNVQNTSSEEIHSNGHSKHPSTGDSPLIGGGVRTPSDIGASGTASSTPPVRTESPTDEPQVLPDVSPVPTHPSVPERAPVKESAPLGQPNHLQKTPDP